MLTLESAGSGTLHPMDCHPGVAHVVAVLADRGGQRPHHRTPPAPTPRRSTSRWTRCRRRSTRSRRNWGRPSTALTRLSRTAQQPQRDPGRAAQERRRRHRDPVRTQPAGQHADPQRQRPARGARRRAGRRSSACWPTRRRWPSSCPDWCTTTRSKLAPTLEKLNSVTAMLEKNRDNIAKALPGSGEISRSPRARPCPAASYYNAFVPNLCYPRNSSAVPRLRVRVPAVGVDAGQPPDNAGPRALIPVARTTAFRRPG